MSPEKAAEVRAKRGMTSEEARRIGEAGRMRGNALRKAAPALEAALTSLYELATAHGVSESRTIMKNAVATLKAARGETETKE